MSSREAESLAAPAPTGEEQYDLGLTDDVADEAVPTEEERSLIDDIDALIDDARTYFDAELSYQKTRAAFVADCLKKGIGFVVVAIVLAFLAAIGLTVGLIRALTPLITAWGATALVVLAYLLIAYLLVRKAVSTFRSVKAALNEGKDEAGG